MGCTSSRSQSARGGSKKGVRVVAGGSAASESCADDFATDDFATCYSRVMSRASSLHSSGFGAVSTALLPGGLSPDGSGAQSVNGNPLDATASCSVLGHPGAAAAGHVDGLIPFTASPPLFSLPLDADEPVWGLPRFRPIETTHVRDTALPLPSGTASTAVGATPNARLALARDRSRYTISHFALHHSPRRCGGGAAKSPPSKPKGVPAAAAAAKESSPSRRYLFAAPPALGSLEDLLSPENAASEMPLLLRG